MSKAQERARLPRCCGSTRCVTERLSGSWCWRPLLGDAWRAVVFAAAAVEREVGEELGIGITTVEKHREHLMQKLDIHDTAGLTRYAISAGIIESSVQVTII